MDVCGGWMQLTKYSLELVRINLIFFLSRPHGGNTAVSSSTQFVTHLVAHSYCLGPTRGPIRMSGTLSSTPVELTTFSRKWLTCSRRRDYCNANEWLTEFDWLNTSVSCSHPVRSDPQSCSPRSGYLLSTDLCMCGNTSLLYS